MKEKINGSAFENGCAFFHGKFEAQLEGFAQSIGVSKALVIGRVAALLLSTASGSLLGLEDYLSPLRRDGTKRNSSARKMALADNAHRKPTQRKMSAAARKRISFAQKARWAKWRAGKKAA